MLDAAVDTTTQELILELDEIHFIIKKLVLSETTLLAYVISLNSGIKEKENIDLRKYYGLLKSLAGQSTIDSRHVDTLNDYLSSLINQAKLEMYSLHNPSEEAKPIIRQLAASFIQMHAKIFRNLLQKDIHNDQQVAFLASKIESLKIASAEIEKLNILHFIAQIDGSLSRNLYSQLRTPMFTLFGKAKTDKKLIREIGNLFADLQSKLLTTQALIGALYLFNDDLTVLLHQTLGNLLTQRINNFLLENNPEHRKYDKPDCITQFHTEANNLAMTWPTAMQAKIAAPAA